MPHYVTAEELCAASGLCPADLWELEEVGLLRPTHTTLAPRYRSRLVNWARKLAYLRREGWTLEEIGAWARGRFACGDPRQWPPERDDWRPQGSGIPPRNRGTLKDV